MTADRPTTIDEYLAGVASDEARAALTQLRAIVRDEIPGVVETVSYGVPTFKFAGTMVSFAAFKNHCSFFPGHTVSEFTDDLKGYKTTTGTIQFQPDNPLPEAFVRAILRARGATGLAKNQV